jgi:hypothetical protein
MPDHEGEKALTEPARKEIFLALVNAQDQEMSVLASRRAVAREFGISDKQIQKIEQEGLDKEWPPL